MGLSVYQNRRWDADLLTAAKVVAGGELGEVARFESRLEQPAHPAGLPTSGGGALLDLGSHAADQAMVLFGPVTAVYAEVHLAPGTEGLDDRFFVSLAHAGGTRSHLWGTVDQANWGALHRNGVSEPVPAERGDWGAFYAGLAAAVRGGASMPVDPWDAVAVIEVLDAARASAAGGAVVALG